LALLFVLAVGFVLLGLMLVGAFGEIPSFAEEPRRRRFSPWFSALIGWFCISFFGSSVLAIGRKFFDHRPQLHICSTGIVTIPWSDERIPWSEVSDITTWIHRRQKAIILHLKNPDQFPGRGLAGKLAGINRMLTDGDIAISMTGTNRNFDEAMVAIAFFRSASASSGNLRIKSTQF
jgi:hypothetical protein